MPYPYYPQYYPQNYQQNYFQNNNQPMQIQSGGFVSVRSEEEARNYPIELGKSITFKDESLPYIYTKTMGFSQMDRPTFDKYRLVKEDASVTAYEAHTDTKEKESVNVSPCSCKSDIEAIKKELDSLWETVNSLQEKKAPKKKEVVENE